MQIREVTSEMSVNNRKSNRYDRGHSSRLNIHVAETDSESDGAYYDGIGAELKAERMRCGLELHEVASRLRIREPHLEAIEAGRFGDLPGRIYAIGFVRSYAEFLGADGDVCITLFKAEVGPGGHSRKLIFPVPAAENRRPGWVTLVASVALAAMVYGGWYVWQTEERQVAELVPEVPQRFVEQAEIARVRDETSLAAVGTANASETTGVTLGSGRAVGEPASPGLETTTLDLAVVGRVDNQPSSSPDVQPVAEPVDADNETVPASNVIDANAAETTAASNLVSQPENVGTVSAQPDDTAVTVATAPADEVTQTSVSAEPVQVAAVAPPPPIPTTKPRDEGEPRIYGIANSDARVLVRATDSVQIIVKRLDGTTLLPHRVLQEGDIYRVPNRSDVFLESDKLGALQLIVDGRLIGRGDSLTEPGNGLSLNANLLRSFTN